MLKNLDGKSLFVILLIGYATSSIKHNTVKPDYTEFGCSKYYDEQEYPA